MDLPTFEFPTVKVIGSPNGGMFGLTLTDTHALEVWLNTRTTNPLAKHQDLAHMYWCSCRETFHHYYETYSPLGYRKFWVSTPGSEQSIIEIIRWMENKLGTEPVKISLNLNCKVCPAQLKICNILQFEMTDFWMLNEMRFQFFTAVLKTGMNHVLGTNPITTLKTSKYFIENFTALEKFINGCHWFDRPTITAGAKYPIGWHQHFWKKGTESVLRKPTEEDIRTRAFYLWEKNGGDQWNQAVKDIIPLG